MLKKGFYLKIGLPMLTIIVSLLIVTISCSGYRKFTFSNAFEDCFFEYPSSYHVISIDRAKDGSTIASVFFALWQTKTPQDIHIYITVRKTSNVFANYLELLEYSIGIAQRGQSNDEFNIVERTPLIIDGISGEKIIYYHAIHNPDTYGITNGEITIIEPYPAIEYEAYFEKDRFLWTVKIHSVLDKSEQAKADFQHILQYFRFLN